MAALLQKAGVQPEHRTTTAGAYGIHSLTLGQGRPLLLVHGAGGGGANWYRLLGPLSRDHRVLAPDLPGFGLSSAIRPRSGLGDQAADVLLAWARTSMTEPFDVVGTSFGGLVALRMAQRQPSAIRRLVLLDSVGLGRRVPALIRASALQLTRRLLMNPTRASTAWLFRNLLVADQRAVPGAERELLIDYLWACARASAATLADALGLFAGLTGQREVLSDGELKAVRQPVLVLWGGRDRFLPLSHGRRAAALMANASFEVIPHAGHSPNWEAPGEVVARLRPFLGSA